jgi:hypothetical protein
VLPIEGAGQLGIGSPDRKFHEAGGCHHLPNRSPEDELATSPFDRDLPKRRRAYEYGLISRGNQIEYPPGQFRRTALQPEKDMRVEKETHEFPSNSASISGSGASKSSAI